jgi:hypothetical protein
MVYDVEFRSNWHTKYEFPDLELYVRSQALDLLIIYIPPTPHSNINQMIWLIFEWGKIIEIILKNLPYVNKAIIALLL